MDATVTAHVDPVELAAAEGASRLQMLAHLRGCTPCRRAVAAADPSALFGLLALAPIPAPLLDAVSSGVARRAGEAGPAAGPLAAAASWPRRAAAAAIFILVLLSGYVTLRDRPVVAPQQAQRHSQRADVEVDSGEGVSQVIDLTVGETQLVMVYNGDLRL